MNRKQRRIIQSGEQGKAVIKLHGKSYTVEEASELALNAHNLKNFQAAVDMYRLILAKVPDYAEIHNNMGVALQEMERYDEALESYEKATALNPGYADAYNNMGNTLLKTNRHEKALASYDKAIAFKPDHVPAYYNRGLSLQKIQQYDAALASYDQALALHPGYAEALIHRGDILQEMGRYGEALASYDKAIALRPDYLDSYNNRGNTLQKMMRSDEALASYDKAIALRPDHAGSHYNRGLVLQKMEQYDAALASYAKAIECNPGYVEAHINRGIVLQEMGRHNEALESYVKALELRPNHADSYNNMGITLQEMMHYDKALESYDKAIALNPGSAEAYNNRGVVLQKMNRFEESLASCDKAIALKPRYPSAHNNRAITLQDMKRYDEALASCDKAIALKPDYAEAYNNRGITLLSMGDMQGAEKMFLKSMEIKPDYSKPLFGLAKIRTYRDAGHADIKNIHRLLDNPGTSPGDRSYLYFSLGKIYDDCSRYDEAFECYRQANQLVNTMISYNADGAAALTKAITEVFSRDFLARPFAFASNSRSPLFIVGMPRSGTTLLASMLSNHRSIATAGELPTIIEFTSRLIPYPQAATQITPAIAARMINDYEKRLRRDVGSDVPHVVDKNPLNFRHLGLITMLFPKARILHCMRNPMDTCLSNYFQRFAPDYNYAFDLRNIGHFYGEYAKLMEHWRKALPSGMIEVSYEDMITDTEQTARKMLGLLGMEWDEHCLAPHTNPCAVETASNWQVRQPIYSQSMERWRHYEKHLTPLREALRH